MRLNADAAPVLRWSGSKAKLLTRLEQAAPTNFNAYIEPFAGSACLYFKLQPKEAILGDLNQAVIDVYKAIKKNPKGVQKYLDSIPQTAEAYYQLRAIDPYSLSLEQRAAQMIFLMKACFNGVYRTNKKGQFNVPLGSRIYARPSLEETLAVSDRLKNTQLISGDFELLLDRAQTGDFIYLDPPYPSTSRYRGEYGYTARFSENDIERLVVRLKKLTSQGVKIMVSYVDDPLMLNALKGWHTQYALVRRSVAGHGNARKSVTEVIVTNYKASQ